MHEDKKRLLRAFDTALNTADKEGFDRGYDEAMDNAEPDGSFDEGHADGYGEGMNTAWDEARSKGFDEGYDEAMTNFEADIKIASLRKGDKAEIKELKRQVEYNKVHIDKWADDYSSADARRAELLTESFYLKKQIEELEENVDELEANLMRFSEEGRFDHKAFRSGHASGRLLGRMEVEDHVIFSHRDLLHKIEESK